VTGADEDLIVLIYAAGGDASLWPEVMARIAQRIGGDACVAMALACVTDLAPGVRAPQNELRSRFGLTFAEARVAAAVFRGLTLREAAEEFAVSLNTVRFQLARVFEKTGVTRQAELVKMMMRLSGGAYG
jgi:DNA-binding CsgD family transcriptional regulator